MDREVEEYRFLSALFRQFIYSKGVEARQHVIDVAKNTGYFESFRRLLFDKTGWKVE